MVRGNSVIRFSKGGDGGRGGLGGLGAGSGGGGGAGITYFQARKSKASGGGSTKERYQDFLNVAKSQSREVVTASRPLFFLCIMLIILEKTTTFTANLNHPFQEDVGVSDFPDFVATRH